ncbi:MAG TPA: LOG family protein [Vicinamibacterales bacterium]
MAEQALAFHNFEFLESEEARPIRILAEYLEPLRRFRDQQIQDTVVFFGSARVRSRAKAEAALTRLEHQLLRRTTRAGRAAAARAARPTRAQRIALNRARRAVTMSRYYEDARTLAHMLTEWSLSLGFPHHRFVVCSGGGPGIMEAANRGAFEAGGKSIGLNIKLPFEQGLNPYISEGLGFQFHYFFMRKLWFAYLAKALVIFPGGFGTMDEMYEILTLAQTQKLSKKLAVVLYGPDYWNEVMDLKPMATWGMINPEDLSYLQPASTPQEAFEILRDFLTKHHLVPATEQEQQTPGLAKTMG